MKSLCPFLVILSIIFTAVTPSWGETSPTETGTEALEAAGPGKLDANPDKYWYWMVGLANVYPRLRESTSEIDRDINGLFGNLLPRWKEPTTFADWRGDGKLWDVHLGVGRSFNDKWSWFSTVGIIEGTARTDNEYYPLLIPMDVNVKFHRRVWFISTGVDYYPWGKPHIEDAPDGHWLMRRLRASKPYVEAAGGYVNVYTIGQVRVGLPLIGDVAKVKHAEYYDLFYVSPRIGIDIPIDEKSSLAFQAGYLFFTAQPDEFDTASYYVFYKHRF